jgi:hypothetical protein
MKLFRSQSKAERVGSVDGLSLFFGALLGANLGTIQHIPLAEYLQLIMLLAGAVVTIRLVSHSEHKSSVFWTVMLFAALLLGAAFVPRLQPEGLSPEAFHRILTTVGVWLGAVLLVEYWPAGRREAEAAAPTEPAGEPPQA